MTSHWPTFADGLFWCACDNRTFPTEEAWLAHVVDEVLFERGQIAEDLISDLPSSSQPSESSVRHDAPSR